MKPHIVFVITALALSNLACATKGKEAATELATQGAPATKATSPPRVTIATQPVTVIGENYCLGCSLKKAQGAKAQCSVYGHGHALKVESAKGADGAPIAALVGETLHYLENDQSAPLFKGEELHKRRVEVKGKLFGAERTLEVSEIKVL